MSQNRSMVAPGAAYYLLTAGGIIISLAIIAATFPLLTLWVPITLSWPLSWCLALDEGS
jgi:hypothetical protein